MLDPSDLHEVCNFSESANRREREKHAHTHSERMTAIQTKCQNNVNKLSYENMSLPTTTTTTTTEKLTEIYFNSYNNNNCSLHALNLW